MAKPKGIKWSKVLDVNHADQPPIINWINLGNHTMFRISAFFCSGFSYPREGFFVGIERCGCFLFELSRVTGEYVSEKLNVPLADANNLADWINTQMGVKHKKLGSYMAEAIHDEPYALAGERWVSPLAPYYHGSADE